jgi:hypothetical protein
MGTGGGAFVRQVSDFFELDRTSISKLGFLEKAET